MSAGRTLRFNRNPLNTPVVLLAQGDVTISGTIDVSGGNGRIRIDTTDPLAFRNLTIGGSVTRGTRMFALPRGAAAGKFLPHDAGGVGPAAGG